MTQKILYKLIDKHTEMILVTCSTYEEAWDTLCQLEYDSVYIEEYTVPSVSRLGRDPDLH